MKKGLKIIIVVLLLIVLIGGGMFWKQSKEISSLNYEPLNMSVIKDGIFKGNVDTMMIKVEVEVEIKNNQITNIDLLKHDNGMGKPAEKMLDQMIKENTWDVDIISGATLSSEAIKSAVNQAIKKGEIK